METHAMFEIAKLLPQGAMGLVAALCALIAMKIVYDREVQRHRRRTQQLRLAATALEKHASAMKNFFADPAAPKDLQDLLLDFSELQADHEFAKWWAKRDRQGKSKGWDAPTGRQVLHRLDKLQSVRPDLASEFYTAVAGAYVGFLLRWDETAPLFEKHLATLSVEPRKEVVLVAEASSKVASNGSFGAPLPA